ncbi:MAG: hypothetical protein LAT63_17435 [Marinobacter sp.]|nr:hypothetical protein [Marinobacter sp.]
MSVQGGELWAINSDELNDANGETYRFDIDTGSAIEVPGNQPAAPGRAIAVSPNGLWLAVGRAGSASQSPGVYVYEIASGTMVYSRVGVNIFLQGWSDDSSALIIRQAKYDTNFTGMVGVLTAGWVEVLGPNLEDLVVFGTTSVSISGVLGIVGTTIYYSYTIYYFNRTPNRDYFWATFNPATDTSSSKFYAETSLAYAGPSRSLYVPERTQFLAHMGLTGELESIDLALDFVAGAPAGIAGNSVLSLSLAQDGNSVIVEATGEPRYRRFAAANYTFIENLPAAFDALTGRLLYSDDYAIALARAGGGYRIVDTVTNELLEQVNPSVMTGDRYTYQSANYEALVDNNDRPDVGAKLEPPTWLRLGVINPLRMFDGKIGTYTEVDGDLVVSIAAPDLIDGVGLFGVRGAAVQIQLLDDDTVVYDTGVIPLQDSSGVDGWYSHFFLTRGIKSEYVLSSLPPYRGATLRVVVFGLEGVSRLGELVAGQVRRIGDTMFETGVGILDFSRKERDQFGVFDVVEREFSKRANYEVSVRTSQVAWIQQLLANLRATPTVFIGDDARRETVVYGFFRSFDIVLKRPTVSDCTIEVEGLT